MNARTRGVFGAALIALMTAALAAQSGPPLPEDRLPARLFPRKMPLGLPPTLPSPPDNPFTEASFELGRRIFFDPVLSVDRTVACASCHEPDHGFSSRAALPAGVRGRRARRHSPTLFNRGFGERHRWDGTTETLEQQVLLPIEDPDEMDLAVTDAVERLRADAGYREAFEKTYGDGPSQRNLSRALSTFVRGLVTGDSAVDRFQAGDSIALSAAEKAGLWVYESKGRCWQCHAGPNLSDEQLHNTGVSATNGVAAPGLFKVTGKEPDRGLFKTPTLRGLTRTAPYMHDGSLASLADVVEFYNRGGQQNPGLDRRMRPLDLSEADRENLVAFLSALSRSAENSADK